jgi:tRNA modification GTPase
VTAAPGTTRDTIEETISISGIPFILIDTAGVRSTEDEAEALGVAAARRAAAEADLILFVYEAPFGISPTDIEVVEIIAGKPHVYIANKLDMLDPGKTLASIQSANSETVFVSALTGEGIENLRGACVKAALGGSAPSTEDALVSSARHADALRRAAASVKRAKAALTEGLSEEFAATETRSAIRAIGEVTGSSIDETLLSRIFAEFCIGK